MSQSSTSALRNHLLSSILPYSQIPQPEHFVKNKQFYKPQQFIWNNPHRTSKRLYPYYHQFQEEFIKKIKPKIQFLEEQDRINEQQARIRRLSVLRAQTRQKFLERQRMREQLQAKTVSGSKRRKSSTLDSKLPTQYYSSNSNSAKISSSRVYSNSNYIVTQIPAKITQSYQKGLQNYDSNLSNIRKLVSEQVAKNHKKIRSEFQKIKEENQLHNFSTLKKGRKSAGQSKVDDLLD